MILLIFGVLLWSAAHLFPSIAPGARDRLIGAIGMRSYRAGFALYILLSLVLMVVGYRSADWIFVYEPPSWGIHINNPLMLLSVYLFAASGAGGWLASKLRHPMLLGVATWAVAHLLVNGDEASVILFGGLLIWALVSIPLINRRAGSWVPREAKGIKTEIKLITITVLVYGLIILVHWKLLGVRPFPG